MVNVKMSLWQRVLLASTCVLCGGEGQAHLDLCTACAGDLSALQRACYRCAESLTGDSTVEICGSCLRKPPRFHSAHCAYRYSYPIDHLIRALKYHDRLVHGRVLGDLLAHSLHSNRNSPWPEILIPVPLADSRYRERGFNQAIEIATRLQYQLAIPLRSDVLLRTRVTGEQAGLDRIARRRNVRKAFALRVPLGAKHVAIVDDVVTTGSTANEIARVLKRGGATRIEVWAVARAER
jgi:ComF family protein